LVLGPRRFSKSTPFISFFRTVSEEAFKTSKCPSHRPYLRSCWKLQMKGNWQHYTVTEPDPISNGKSSPIPQRREGFITRPNVTKCTRDEKKGINWLSETVGRETKSKCPQSRLSQSNKSPEWRARVTLPEFLCEKEIEITQMWIEPER
jgi:hypothetical protein